MKALVFSGPLLILIIWQLVSVSRELDDEKSASQSDERKED